MSCSWEEGVGLIKCKCQGLLEFQKSALFSHRLRVCVQKWISSCLKLRGRNRDSLQRGVRVVGEKEVFQKCMAIVTQPSKFTKNHRLVLLN